MTDVTSLVIEAQDARSRMQEAKRRVKAEVRRKYEAQMTRDIAEGTLNAEVEFARTLARIHAAGVPQAVLRREVLRTNVWSTWTYWRDMAGIEPDRVTVANARAQREAQREREKIVMEWRNKVLYVLRNPETGEALEHELAVPLYSPAGWYQGAFRSVESAVNTLMGGRREGNRAYFAVTAEIKRAFEEGEITESTNPFDYVNDLPVEEQDDYLRREEQKNFDLNPWIGEEL